MRMLHIVTVGLPRSTIFFTFSHKREEFRKMLLNEKCVLWFSVQILSKTFLILRRNERDMIKNYVGLHVKYPLCFSSFNETWNFRDRYSKKPTNINFLYSPSSESRVVPCGRTDLTKLIVTFRNFAKTPKNHFNFIEEKRVYGNWKTAFLLKSFISVAIQCEKALVVTGKVLRWHLLCLELGWLTVLFLQRNTKNRV